MLLSTVRLGDLRPGFRSDLSPFRVDPNFKIHQRRGNTGNLCAADLDDIEATRRVSWGYCPLTNLTKSNEASVEWQDESSDREKRHTGFHDVEQVRGELARPRQHCGW